MRFRPPKIVIEDGQYLLLITSVREWAGQLYIRNVGYTSCGMHIHPMNMPIAE
jgi:hypothetical protein